MLTGDVHIGKTTACSKVAKRLAQSGHSVRGFLTTPVCDGSQNRLGLEILDLRGGERQQLARTDCELGGPRVGPYSFDADALRWGETLAAEACAAGCDLLVIDEIGRLELEKGRGFNRILALLAGPLVPRTLVVVRSELYPTFCCRLPDFVHTAYSVTTASREALEDKLVTQWFLGFDCVPGNSRE